jgi:hypothetical protein
LWPRTIRMHFWIAAAGMRAVEDMEMFGMKDSLQSSCKIRPV